MASRSGNVVLWLHISLSLFLSVSLFLFLFFLFIFPVSVFLRLFFSKFWVTWVENILICFYKVPFKCFVIRNLNEGCCPHCRCDPDVCLWMGRPRNICSILTLTHELLASPLNRNLKQSNPESYRSTNLLGELVASTLYSLLFFLIAHTFFGVLMCLQISFYVHYFSFNSVYSKKKVKWSRYRRGVAQRVGRGIALLFHDRSTRRGWVVNNAPRPHFTPVKDPVPILQEAGWAPEPVWTGGKSRPHGVRSRTVQPVVSRYTDWATGPTFLCTVVFQKI